MRKSVSSISITCPKDLIEPIYIPTGKGTNSEVLEIIVSSTSTDPYHYVLTIKFLHNISKSGGKITLRLVQENQVAIAQHYKYKYIQSLQIGTNYYYAFQILN